MRIASKQSIKIQLKCLGVNIIDGDKVKMADIPKIITVLQHVAVAAFGGYKPGDILKYKDRSGKDDYLTVIYPEEDGFYYYCSDAKGDIDDTKRLSPWHSNMLLGAEDTLQKVGRKPLKEKKIKEFSYVNTEYNPINDQMVQLDGRIEFFNKYAPKKIQNIFNKQENKNYHQENNVMVMDFVKWVMDGKAPEDFKAKA
jgi:hypothetical protein